MVHQQVARQRRQPGLEVALLRVEAGQVAVKLQEDVLGQVLGVRGRSGKPVADAVDAPVLRGHQLLPRVLVAGNALANHAVQCILLGLLIGGALQYSLVPCRLMRRLMRRHRSRIGRWQKCTSWRTGCALPAARRLGHSPRLRHRHLQNSHARYTQGRAHWFNA